MFLAFFHGMVYGLILDLFFGKTLLINTILYGLLGFATGKLQNKTSSENKMSLILVGVVSSLIFITVYYFINSLLYGVDFDFMYYLKVLIMEAIYNMFISLMIFTPVSALGRAINKCKKSYYLEPEW